VARRARVPRKVLPPHHPADGPPPEHLELQKLRREELATQMVASGFEYEQMVRAVREQTKCTRQEADLAVRTVEAEFRDRARGRKELDQQSMRRRLQRTIQSMFAIANDSTKPEARRSSAAQAQAKLESQLATLIGLNEPERKIVEINTYSEVVTKLMSSVTDEDLDREVLEELERDERLKLLPPAPKVAN
jgi:hypothetical protein